MSYSTEIVPEEPHVHRSFDIDGNIESYRTNRIYNHKTKKWDKFFGDTWFRKRIMRYDTWEPAVSKDGGECVSLTNRIFSEHKPSNQIYRCKIDYKNNKVLAQSSNVKSSYHTYYEATSNNTGELNHLSFQQIKRKMLKRIKNFTLDTNFGLKIDCTYSPNTQSATTAINEPIGSKMLKNNKFIFKFRKPILSRIVNFFKILR